MNINRTNIEELVTQTASDSGYILTPEELNKIVDEITLVLAKTIIGSTRTGGI